MLRGDPAAELIRYLNSKGADAVVSGSRGLGNLRGLVIGSVSQKLSQHAPCACIMVK
ncbi:MAG: universal stress protein [Proteobacteria bacterium]|nr:MAG: universal stress protein [Pseudomonadota bacterium]